MAEEPRWRRAGNAQLPLVEQFLRRREKHCVSACGRFLQFRPSRDHIWYIPGPEDGMRALLLHSRRSLFPLFDGDSPVPFPRFMPRFLRAVPIYIVQGLEKDAALLEHYMGSCGYRATEVLDYYLMELDSVDDMPRLEDCSPGVRNLRIREAVKGDLDALYELQAAYEKEEVLPQGAVFNPVSCRLSLEGIFSRERLFLAELGDNVVGKINTNAKSFTRYQIGGVYVRPEYRGLGIATSMAAAFAEALLSEGLGLSLFVKQRNESARAVYRRVGFTLSGEYRISYY